MTKNLSPTFNISTYTQAHLRTLMSIEFDGMEPEQVFEIMGDPERITDWYLLAKDVKIHPPGPDGEANFNVEFVFFGDVYEEILLWDIPYRYVYSAQGDDFPIKDYVALIEIDQTGPSSGVMRWSTYFEVIEGKHNQRIIPVILPAINTRSAELLVPLIAGVSHSEKSFFEGF